MPFSQIVEIDNLGHEPCRDVFFSNCQEFLSCRDVLVGGVKIESLDRDHFETNQDKSRSPGLVFSNFYSHHREESLPLEVPGYNPSMHCQFGSDQSFSEKSKKGRASLDPLWPLQWTFMTHSRSQVTQITDTIRFKVVEQ